MDNQNKEKSLVLVIDDDRTIRHMVSRSLDQIGCDVIEAEESQSGLAVVLDKSPDVVLLDIMLPKISGLDVFQRIREIDRKIPVIFITAGTDSATAIKAMQLGAFDYVTKPLDLPKLNTLVLSAIRSRRLMNVPVAVEALESVEMQGDLFVGSSPQMMEVFKQVGRVATQDVTVLIRGESGSGKELVARAIYQYSNRSNEPFMAVNCAAIPDQLLESELFGHEKGSFTGADKRRIGKFEQCNGGTLFLDEIGDMTPLVQGKVLRLLQEQHFERVGGNETITTNVRIVTATNRDLEQMVEDGEYRGDLYYRLNGITINLPPLRERGEDLVKLIEYFFSKVRIELGKHEVVGISPDALEIYRKHSWPGNVRELQSVIRQSLLNTTGTVIVPDSIPDELLDDEPVIVNSTASPEVENENQVNIERFIKKRLEESSTDLYAETLEVMEKLLLTQVLQHTEGNQTRASEILGITRGKIRDRIQSFGIKFDKNVHVDENTTPSQ
ncbi:sigma-54 dependent transcriptional regulator [Rubinisphaera sp.]|uniref:sigma-54-dependent transcriptional regulator n=1 Tax=Rubinisphaera sp. TaxID=2024857 RepID=UPI000C0E1B71|nr:sigma-54 dependent transcriptional regulator [Rubinisphaera sp.]MBV10677.1 Fis family transcriptional regulator [Rubinisphaera sp.]HCS52431.1 sigma-54-dependent Fis family transcriptional regulator [Planctomycetaceae bacterium]|tara:strand:+ start:17670 stop:19163 length:1494 start_codon:yes stop_codon:yes gene_type:complete